MARSAPSWSALQGAIAGEVVLAGGPGYEAVRQGNTHFAGEHCSINFQGYMEGGAQEGQRAATEVLTDYNLK